MKTLKNKIKEVRKIRDLQKQSLDMEKDDYMVGLYNGLEFSLAIMEGREPVFLSCVNNHECIEEIEEQNGRTVASGIIRRSGVK